jgi:serine protease Do
MKMPFALQSRSSRRQENQNSKKSSVAPKHGRDDGGGPTFGHVVPAVFSEALSSLQRRVSILTSAATITLLFLAHTSFAADDSSPKLPRSRLRSGDETLKAFAPIAEATRHSIVRFNVNGEPVSLGAIVDTNGLAIAKASEIKPGKLTCWLATEKEVDAEVMAVDDEEDVALVRVHAQGLKPIRWSTNDVVIGQWAITPGIIETPHAVGIVSALPRRIRPERAFVGIGFDLSSTTPKIGQVLAGLGAEKAGLQAGDVILAVDDVPVTNRLQVIDIVREFREGRIVHLTIQRDEDDEFGVDIKLMVPHDDEFGFASYQQEYRRLAGRVSHRSEGFQRAIEHDTVLQPWLCGGPLVNLDGEAIGLNIARAGRVSTYALPARLVLEVIEKLKSAEKS